MSEEKKISRQTALDSLGVLKRGSLNEVGRRKLTLILQYLLQETDSLHKEELKRPVGRPRKGD